MSVEPIEESAVGDFAVLLLRGMGYNSRGREIRTRIDIPLVICGDRRHAKIDVCIVDRNRILLLIQEDKQRRYRSNPEPQLIAEASLQIIRLVTKPTSP